MNLTVEILPCTIIPDRWVAALVVDGVPTTFECHHLHHAPEAAEKCLKTVLKRATKIVTDPTFKDTPLNTEGLHEWETTEMSEPGRWNMPIRPIQSMIRLHMHRNFSWTKSLTNPLDISGDSAHN